MKICIDCKTEKPLSEFYKHKRMADGHLNSCKECKKAAVRNHRANNESVREYDRARYQLPERRAASREIVRRWRERNPEKYRAQTAVGNAVRDGKLTRADRCEQCGRDHDIHAHHDDYSRPLDVRWLCARCHHVGHSEYN